MTANQLLSRTLQALPGPLRRTLYGALGLVGVALAVLSLLEVDSLGPVTLSRALEVYAVVSAATGGVALANVGPSTGDDVELAEFQEDADLSSFQPIGHSADVYGSPA